MLYLNPNKEKILTFEVELSGASSSEIDGFVRFFISEEVQLGFPVIVGEGQIQAVIAPLKSLVKKPIKNGTIFEAQLDLYTEEKDYFSPWNGEIEVKMPVMIEAKLTEEDTKRGSKKFGATVKSIQEEKVTRKSVRPKPKMLREVGTHRRIKRTLSEDKAVRPSKKRITKTTLENLTESQVYHLMEKLGTTNPRIKEILYEQASSQSKSGKPSDVLKEIIKIMGRKKLQKRGISRG